MGNSLYESEAQAGEDDDVKAFAARNASAGAELSHLAQALHEQTGTSTR